jgi:hypothetical protein
MLLDEAKRRKKGEKLDAYPTEPTKDTLQMKVSKTKWTSKSFSTGWTTRSSDYLTIMGDVKGYPEFGYISLSMTQVQKVMDKKGLDASVNEIYGNDDLPKKIENLFIGKTVTISGTFNSNGKMIFGKRVKVDKI